VPPLISQTLNLWKDSSLATVVGVGEMMYQAARVESASFRSAEAFAFTTSAYLAVSLLITGLGVWFQQRYPVRKP
jgi:polar amino acid transport system permease protein